MEERDRTDPSPTEAVANARLALRGRQTRLQRLLASNEGAEAEIELARRDIAKAQAALDEAIRVRDAELRRRT
jgi:hypothetical protein